MLLALKIALQKNLHASCVTYKFKSGLCNECFYAECVRHLSVRIGESLLMMRNKPSLNRNIRSTPL